MDKANEIMNELTDMANFKNFGREVETEEEILNADGSRNWQANILLDNVKRLEQENAELKAYKDVNEDFKTAWAELKAENDRLKEEIKQLEVFIKSDSEIDHINHEYTYKLKQTLQEIKAIAEKRNYLNYGEALDDILDLITKAESEG
jgi:uncharacterized phage infection (PIP) family protein YhgE